MNNDLVAYTTNDGHIEIIAGSPELASAIAKSLGLELGDPVITTITN